MTGHAEDCHIRQRSHLLSIRDHNCSGCTCGLRDAIELAVCDDCRDEIAWYAAKDGELIEAYCDPCYGDRLIETEAQHD